MAAGLSALLSRAGALGGNLLMGYLIDRHCMLVIIIVSAQLFACAVLALFTPGKEEDPGKPSDPEANGGKVP